jgi:hypothetical protein
MTVALAKVLMSAALAIEVNSRKVEFACAASAQ